MTGALRPADVIWNLETAEHQSPLFGHLPKPIPPILYPYKLLASDPSYSDPES